jgi:hypothetical protein
MHCGVSRCKLTENLLMMYIPSGRKRMVKTMWIHSRSSVPRRLLMVVWPKSAVVPCNSP